MSTEAGRAPERYKERYNRILAEELLYSRTWTSEAERAGAIKIWNVHYNYHRAHAAVGDQPPRLTTPHRRHQRHEPQHLAALDQLDPAERATIRASTEGAFLRHQARRRSAS